MDARAPGASPATLIIISQMGKYDPETPILLLTRLAGRLALDLASRRTRMACGPLQTSPKDDGPMHSDMLQVAHLAGMLG